MVYANTYDLARYLTDYYNGVIWDANVINRNSIQNMYGLNPFLPTKKINERYFNTTFF